MEAMRRAPKVRWYAGWMLSIGIAFLLFACVIGVARKSIRESGPVRINRGIYGGDPFAITVCAGLLFTGIGVYALYHRKD